MPNHRFVQCVQKCRLGSTTLRNIPCKQSQFLPFPYDVKNGVDKLSSLGVMPLGPVITTHIQLPEQEVIQAENLSVWPGSDTIHGTQFQIHENCLEHHPPTTRFVVVHIDPPQLEIRVAIVLTRGIIPMLRPCTPIPKTLPQSSSHTSC